MGRVGREVHVERRAARRLPYEVLCGLGVQVGVVYLGAVVANDLTVLVYVVGGGAGVGSFPGVPPVPARRHVGGRGIVTVAVQPIAVEVLADENGVVSCSVEPGGYRGVLATVVVEVPETPIGGTLTHTPWLWAYWPRRVLALEGQHRERVTHALVNFTPWLVRRFCVLGM